MNIEHGLELVGYLRARGHIAYGETPGAQALSGGVSNRVVLVRRASGETWVLKQGLSRLRVATEWRCDPARVAREALGMRILAELAPPGAVPRLLFEDPLEHLLAMQAVKEPHSTLQALLMAGQARAHLLQDLGALVGTIHRRGALRPDLASSLDQRFFEALRIEPYFSFVAERVPRAAAFLHRLSDRLRSARSSVVHGDFSPKNILVRDAAVVLLDHEVIHYGDPSFDVGFFLAHVLSKAHHLPAQRDALAAFVGVFWGSYQEASGPALGSLGAERQAVEVALGCLLARSRGRSPLAYLTSDQRDRQERAVLELIEPQATPRGVTDLVRKFLERV